MNADMNRRRAAVLFDLDGTLIDTMKLYLECYRRALEPHLERALSDAELLALKPRSELRLLRGQAGHHFADAAVEQFYRLYEELHDTHFDGIYDGVPALLDGLRGGGHPIGIVTGKSRRSWEITVARAELGPFDVLVFDDDVRAPKPDPHGIRIALDELGADATRSLYVGDTVGDVDAALAAGVRPVAALWARSAERRARFRAEAEAAGAVIAASPQEVLKLV
jgi:pyrophosphatase PpaX